jgi:REP element-mobilizing transposase RayT
MAYYERYLPHYQPPDATFFLTFRLAGSLPAAVVERLRSDLEEEKRHLVSIQNSKRRNAEFGRLYQEYFERFDGLLDSDKSGPQWLAQPLVAEVVAEAIRYRDGKAFDVNAYCIMPNHVHMIVALGKGGFSCSPLADKRVDMNADPSEKELPLFRILQSLKRHAARKSNLILGRQGPFWQPESYDHVIRDGAELERMLWYVLYNPVKAKLADSWKVWPWTYCKGGLL